MLTKEQIEQIKTIVAHTCYESKTAELIDITLGEIEEIVGTKDYTVGYVLPSEWAKKHLGDIIRFVVFENGTAKVYDFSVVPNVRIEETIGE